MSVPAAAQVTSLDVDGLLTEYRTGRAQAALFDPRFDPRGGAGAGHDEFVDAAGNIRPAWTELAETIARRGVRGLDRLRDEVRTLVDNDGITYTDPGGVPAPWRLDPVPLLITPEDWQTLEAGLVQRSRLLDAILADLYGPQDALTSGILPAPLLFGHPGYLRAARGIEVPGRHQLFLHGCDVSRSNGGFVVNADWTQAPSGAGYAMADRRVVGSAISELYEQLTPRATSQFAHTLRSALLEAAPEATEDPAVVVLSPGIHSETAFDQAYLASTLGFPLVESADLVVRDGRLWMRSLGTLQRVDVVLRRVDAAYSDPLDLRPDSRLGVVGLVEAARRGAVTVVNTLGSGILESPAILRFLPELAERLLGEAPLLPTTPTYWGGIDTERSHLLKHLDALLIRSTTGGPDQVGPELTRSQRAELSARISAAPWQWIGQELPQYSSAPIVGRVGIAAANVGMRLFAVSQRGGYAPMIGGLGYVAAAHGIGPRFNDGAAKDIWVLPSSTTPEQPSATPPPAAPVVVADLAAVSSPRVLSDLFWTGRYAERAESTARLLTVTRERYHEYRHRQYAPASACIPVLLSALGRLTGTDVAGAGDRAEMIATAPSTLWSITADRDRAGSLAQSVERLGLAARSVRDQLSNDTWMILAAVDRAVLELPSAAPETHSLADTKMAAAHARTLAGMLALSGVAAESMVQDVGWTMADIGKRIERTLTLAGLLRATLTTARRGEAAQVITESVLTACESAVIFRRRNLGQVSVPAVADLLLFDASNPRSLVYQLDRLRTHLRALPAATGSSRPERLVDELNTRLRRIDPAELGRADPHGDLLALRGLLDGVLDGVRELSDVITATQLSLPGGMQPLWGPGQRRQMP